MRYNADVLLMLKCQNSDFLRKNQIFFRLLGRKKSNFKPKSARSDQSGSTAAIVGCGPIINVVR